MSSFAFAYPTQPQPTNPFGLPQTSGINPSVGSSTDTWYGQLFNWANLGAQTYLADQAINSPRAATVTYAPNGQLQTVGSGNAAAAVGSSSLLTFLSTSTGLLVIFMVVLVLVLRK